MRHCLKISLRIHIVNSDIGESDEVQTFLQHILTINELFTGVDTVHDIKVSTNKIKETYKQAASVYNDMSDALKVV